MPTFKFTAQDSQGKMYSDTVYADSMMTARQKLLKMNVNPQTLVVDEGVAHASGGFFTSISHHEMLTFFSSISIAINAGGSLRESLQAFADQTTNIKMRGLLEDLVRLIESGKSFSDALRQHTQYFSNDFISLMAAGEKAGTLAEMLNSFAIYSEKQAKIRAKARGAAIYPAVMLSVAGVVVVILTTVIFPKFISSFNIPFDQLPPLTQYVSLVSQFFIGHWFEFLLGVPIFFFALGWWVNKTPQGSKFMHWFQFNAPLFGGLMKKFYVSRFAHVLGGQLKGGVPGLSALKVVRDVTDNVYFQRIVDEVIDSIRSGGTYAAPLRKHPDVIPPIVALMFSIGEKTGSISEVLEKIGNYYDDQVAQTTEVMVSLMEPLMIVVMGVTVTVIAVSMFLPIFNMTKMIH
ncbi:MAG: type II secretion system F family protein [Candidatus Wallbacteria bacterium]|nr:type II secretion system F family protein [Candidatus Wallbacteria bacterium]